MMDEAGDVARITAGWDADEDFHRDLASYVAAIEDGRVPADEETIEDRLARLVAEAERVHAPRIAEIEAAQKNGTLGELARLIPPVQEQVRTRRIAELEAGVAALAAAYRADPAHEAALLRLLEDVDAGNVPNDPPGILEGWIERSRKHLGES